MMFHVGQKVVCVDASNSILEEGAIYTVNYTADLPEFVCVDGVGEWKYGIPPGWWPRRFRPIVSRKTDISIFKALLEPNAKLLEGV